MLCEDASVAEIFGRRGAQFMSSGCRCKWLAGRVEEKKKKSGTCCGLGGGGEYLCYNLNMQTAADKAWMVVQIMRMEACDKLHG